MAKRHPDWVLHIWGVGDLREELEKQIEQMGMKEHVCMMGFTTEMGEVMSKGSLMVLASLGESFSLVTLEAMSVGIPTVVYDCPGGISYVVKDGETGYLIPLHDEETFVERVCQLIENEDQRRAMGMAGLRESEKYKMDIIIQRWMALFQELLAKKRGTKT